MIRTFIAFIFLIPALSVVAAAEPTYYAEIGDDGIVIRVIVADKKFIESGAAGNKSRWVETSTRSGLRKNFASPGYIYDKTRAAFIAQKPYPSWVLDEPTARWKAPVNQPSDGKAYGWNENSRKWIELEAPAEGIRR